MACCEVLTFSGWRSIVVLEMDELSWTGWRPAENLCGYVLENRLVIRPVLTKRRGELEGKVDFGLSVCDVKSDG